VTIVAFLLAGFCRNGVPVWIFPPAMVCDTALLIHYL
jgi:hypothetical protein